MDYTNNYHLPQWVKSDRIMMDDFNNAMSAIDSGIKSAQNAANSAKSAASAAQNAANAAKNTAQNAYSPSQKPYAAGSYTGDSGTQTIHLGFRPSFVIVCGAETAGDVGYISRVTCYFGLTAGNILKSRISFTNDGFTVHPYPNNGENLPALNYNGRTYDYIAFR